MCAESSNEMTEIVKSNCVAHVSDRHTGFQEEACPLKSEANQVFMWRDSNQFSKDSREKERTHGYTRRQLRKRMPVSGIHLHGLTRCTYAICVPLQLLRTVHAHTVVLGSLCCIHEIACQHVQRFGIVSNGARKKLQPQEGKAIRHWNDQRQAPNDEKVVYSCLLSKKLQARTLFRVLKYLI